MGHERGRGLALADFPLALAMAWQRKHGPMSSLWNSLTETVNDYATPLKNSVVDLLNEADEQAADFLTPQQPGVEELGGNLNGHKDEEDGAHSRQATRENASVRGRLAAQVCCEAPKGGERVVEITDTPTGKRN